MQKGKNMERYGRLHLPDSLRGITLISMILYHGAWDLVYIYGWRWRWYHGTGAYIWQQSICWMFILLAGFCWSFGKKPLKRGLIVFLGGALITFVTTLVMWENRVVFGVLTLLGSCMLLMIPLEKLLKRVPATAGVLGSMLLFFLTRNINLGYLGFEGMTLCELPNGLYRNLLTTYLGFPMPGFFSTDYFSLFPWLFLFLCGYFLYRICAEKNILQGKAFKLGCKPMSFIGRHSLMIYLLHQPVLYGICFVINSLL